jgi:phosphoribosyl 1,2-cyclic phosphodiesterase
MRVKIWGARGSIGTPERRNSRYGGNTPCIEVRLANGTLIVLDCGSGFRSLGKSLLREFNEQSIYGYIFLTHFHWDHIQGVPFFLPLYKKGNIFLFHSADRKGREIKAAIEGQMSTPYFPVDMDAMQGTRHFFDLDYSPINVNGAIMTAGPLYHPQGCVGYRVEADGAVLTLATDTEPGSPLHDRSVRKLSEGADVLIYDAQYTPEQLAGEKKGWGHSSWGEGVRIAEECSVKNLLLFHHDPDRDDSSVDAMVERARQEFTNVNGAAEGMKFSLSEGSIEWGQEIPAQNRRRHRRLQMELPIRVKWCEASGEKLETEGVTRDLSKTGVYFLSPRQMRPVAPMELDLLMPEEVPQAVSAPVRYQAEFIRSEQINGGLAVYPPKLGVAARFLRTPFEGQDESSGE